MLLKCTKGINHRKRVISSAIVIIIILSSIAGAVITAPVAVYALSAGGIKTTIASLIISLMLQTGVAPTSQTYLDALNTSYGYTIETAISEGLLTETAEGLIDSGLSSAIEGAAAYSDLGLADIFTTTAADGAGVIASSGAVNIANTAINVGTVGTIGAFAGAAAVGVGLGVLANHLIEKYGDQIKVGLGIDAASNAQRFAKANPNGRVFTIKYDGYTDYYCFFADSVVGVYREGTSDITWKIQNLSDVGARYRKMSTASSETGGTITDSQIGYRPNVSYIDGFAKVTLNEYNNIKELINNGTIPKPVVKSPDMVGTVGNLYYDSENETFPGVVSQIPEGGDMKPVDMNDYQDFLNNANNNTENGDTGEETQGQTFNDFIDPYIVDAPTIPDQPIIPENPDDVPTVPDRPVVPDQPTIPDKPNIDQETLDKALEGATTIDLRAIFPFCIPFDLYNLLLIFDTGENRKAPHITFTFPLTDWVIDVDLAPFDPVAGILRLLELILFIIGLAVATRSLIGAGGS